MVSKIDLPEPLIETVEGIAVVRDDLLEGGSKRRYLYAFLAAVACDEWVYASPACGYAQVSISYVCRDIGKKATVFVPKRGELHEYSKLAKRQGARIIEVPMGYLSNLKAKAAEYVASTRGSSLAPFGLDHPMVVQSIANVAKSLCINPPEVWSAMSSGVLSRGLQLAWPQAKVFGVRIGHKTTQRERGRAHIYVAPETFAKAARNPPPFPSCQNYDAKAWQFIKLHASPGALFWNVAK